MAFSLAETLALAALFGLFAAFVIALLHLRKSAPSADDEPEPEAAAAAEEVTAARPRAAPRRRRGGLDRLRQAVDNDGANGAGPAGEGGRVKKKKEANREAKREAREAHLARLEELREREQREREEREEQEKAEEQRQLELEEREKKEQAEREKKEQEEYEAWKGLFSVEEEGEEADALGAEDPELLSKFCDYVKQAKIVVLEELAGEFSLRTEEAIQRLSALEEAGTLSGFFDDRGKFIHVSVEEMEAVAQFIRKRGRVSIPELAAESTSLLQLDAAAAV